MPEVITEVQMGPPGQTGSWRENRVGRRAAVLSGLPGEVFRRAFASGMTRAEYP